VIGPAPHGFIFAIPRHQAFIYQVIREGWLKRVNNFAPFAALLGHQAAEDGVMVSPSAYYWAPDGTVESLSAASTDESGNRTLSITIRAGFSTHVMGQVAPG
jgi:hypothetical protein